MGETKVCRCICCGVDVTVTKFASAQKVKCEDCKASGAEPNMDIIVAAKEEQEVKKESRQADGIIGDKKKSVCTKCGKETLIGKFASHKTALCDECKGEQPVSSGSQNKRIPVHMDRIDESLLPKLEELYVIPVTIANPKLRHVTCPACGTHNMNILKIHDSSAHRGLVIEYQCQNDDCMLLTTISEQSTCRINPKPGQLFNYRGEQMTSLISKLSDTRCKNIMQHMYGLLQDNGIEIGYNVEEYVNIDQIKKAVPTGLNLDKLKKMIEECMETEEQ